MKSDTTTGRTQKYIRFFDSEDDAAECMRQVNRGRHRVGNNILVVLTDGPENDYAVVDIRTAIDMAVPYRWEV